MRQTAKRKRRSGRIGCSSLSPQCSHHLPSSLPLLAHTNFILLPLALACTPTQMSGSPTQNARTRTGPMPFWPRAQVEWAPPRWAVNRARATRRYPESLRDASSAERLLCVSLIWSGSARGRWDQAIHRGYHLGEVAGHWVHACRLAFASRGSQIELSHPHSCALHRDPRS
jgi:hypothetical protein